MDKQADSNVKFSKGFFTSIKPCKTSCSKNPDDYDKPFVWSKSVLNGKSKIKLVSLKNTKRGCWETK